MKLHYTLSIVFFSLAAPMAVHAGCLQLLKTEVPKTKPASQELQTVQDWVRELAPEEFVTNLQASTKFRDFLKDRDLDFSALAEARQNNWPVRYVLSRWENWRKITPEQRSMARAFEFLKMQPKSDAPNHFVPRVT